MVSRSYKHVSLLEFLKKKVLKILDKVEFLDAFFDFSIKKFHQNTYGVEFLNFRKSKKTFHMNRIQKFQEKPVTFR